MESNGIILPLFTVVITLQAITTALVIWLIITRIDKAKVVKKATHQPVSARRTTKATPKARVTGSPQNIESPKALESVSLDDIDDDEFNELDDLETLDKELK